MVRNYIHNMTTFFGGLIIGLINCWQIALLTLATGPFIVAAGGISNIFLHRLAENIQDAYAEAADTLRYGILISLVQGLGLGFTYGLAICSCALQLSVGRISFVLIKSVIFNGLNQAATNFYSFEQGRIAAYRLFEMISHSNSSLNQDGSTLATMQGNIEFKNVYFSYLSRPKIPILSDFYQTVPARKTVALVGRNGSRKSSIIPLMERFYDPTLGEVILDGENIKHLKLEWLRSQIGQVTQEPALLSLSIKDNIAYGRSATFDQIEEVGRTGLALTEEHKIKISIARAVLSYPSFLLLDEVTSGLDFEAEKDVQEALDILIVKSLQCAFSHLHEYQMDCKKFLQFIKDKKKRIDLDQKEASLKWKQKLKTVAKAKADAEAKESKLKASTKHKRRSYSESDSGNEDNMYNIF
ncbi:hypothetical protein ZIOFF_001975 [Zingiber officinale]|uniref:Uncharacterized protein n=1 Tax=Zingiber officinale TaxID=94328 RepID=A0A8J5IKL5_ZINOF|nr:hypothetical protein ZIOFF_001975 [Zingiber officinale]